LLTCAKQRSRNIVESAVERKHAPEYDTGARLYRIGLCVSGRLLDVGVELLTCVCAVRLGTSWRRLDVWRLRWYAALRYRVLGAI
jgi:hypothetical protein